MSSFSEQVRMTAERKLILSAMLCPAEEEFHTQDLQPLFLCRDMEEAVLLPVLLPTFCVAVFKIRISCVFSQLIKTFLSLKYHFILM